MKPVPIAKRTSVQPDATRFNVSNVFSETTLTPQQQQAVVWLVVGMSVQEIANRLNLHRSTLWHWRKLETFQACYNALLHEVKQDTIDGLLAMHGDALATVHRVLKEGSDATALRAATFILEHISELEPGSSDPRALVREHCMQEPFDALFREISGGTFDEHAYERRCRELNLEP